MKIDDSSNNNKNIPCKQHHEAQPSTNILSKHSQQNIHRIHTGTRIYTRSYQQLYSQLSAVTRSHPHIYLLLPAATCNYPQIPVVTCRYTRSYLQLRGSNKKDKKKTKTKRTQKNTKKTPKKYDIYPTTHVYI